MLKHPYFFQSFFMGGFESCYALNEHRQRFDLLQSTRHDVLCREDYRMLKDLGIYTVRESLAWHQIDQGNGRYDFTRFERMMQIAREEGIQVIWGLNHFDFPADLDPFSDAFIPRFAAYAEAAVKTIRRYVPPGLLYIIPFNEISFVSWMCGDVGVWGPYGIKQGWELKKQIASAVITAVRRLKELDPELVFIHPDPIMKRLAAPGTSEAVKRYVRDFEKIVYQAWDMIGGFVNPELGGKPEYLDIIGLNYYISNQDEVISLRKAMGTQDGFIEAKAMEFDSPNRVGLDRIIEEVFQRYNRPVLISETGSYGSLRIPWWRRILTELNRALENGHPVLGICAYPIIDRPDWHLGHLTNSGFWDFIADDPEYKRVPQEELINLVRHYIRAHQSKESPARLK